MEELADRPDAARPGALPYESLVPLDEVIAASTGYGAASGRVQRQYEELLGELGAELSILREAPLADIERQAGAAGGGGDPPPAQRRGGAPARV